ncbi:MAG: DUF3800 domain-containing protein [Chloroflexi bacterium]|nr:DUF3800 domain-containing protein [Chloroflexota bacterium]
MNNAKVVIDGSGSRDFRQQLQTYLKRRINDPKQHYIREVRVHDSLRNNLLQMADMVAGAIHRSFGEKNDAQVYRALIRHREVHVQLWPK